MKRRIDDFAVEHYVEHTYPIRMNNIYVYSVFVDCRALICALRAKNRVTRSESNSGQCIAARFAKNSIVRFAAAETCNILWDDSCTRAQILYYFFFLSLFGSFVGSLFFAERTRRTDTWWRHGAPMATEKHKDLVHLNRKCIWTKSRTRQWSTSINTKKRRTMQRHPRHMCIVYELHALRLPNEHVLFICPLDRPQCWPLPLIQQSN